jgi:hypothetical protein
MAPSAGDPPLSFAPRRAGSAALALASAFPASAQPLVTAAWPEASVSLPLVLVRR